MFKKGTIGILMAAAVFMATVFFLDAFAQPLDFGRVGIAEITEQSVTIGSVANDRTVEHENLDTTARTSMVPGDEYLVAEPFRLLVHAQDITLWLDNVEAGLQILDVVKDGDRYVPAGGAPMLTSEIEVTNHPFLCYGNLTASEVIRSGKDCDRVGPTMTFSGSDLDDTGDNGEKLSLIYSFKFVDLPNYGNNKAWENHYVQTVPLKDRLEFLFSNKYKDLLEACLAKYETSTDPVFRAECEALFNSMKKDASVVDPLSSHRIYEVGIGLIFLAIFLMLLLILLIMRRRQDKEEEEAAALAAAQDEGPPGLADPDFDRATLEKSVLKDLGFDESGVARG